MGMKATTWKTLTHNGPLFPEAYKPIGITVKGKQLSPLAEEMLNAWARIAETDYVKDPVFIANFGIDFGRNIDASLKFPEDFGPAIQQLRAKQAADKEKRAAMTKEERAEAKAAKDALQRKYGFAYMDGKEIPIGAYMLEPAGIYMGRGDHPLKGRWKAAITPEHVTINASKGDVPPPPAGHKWEQVIQSGGQFPFAFNTTVGDHVIGKQVRFGLSDISQGNDAAKFDKAMRMNQKAKELESHIEAGCKAGNEAALIAWLIQNTAIRVGNDRDPSSNAQTVGASTLRVKNLKVTVSEV
jgi:DNA topoisomerase-1